MGNTVTLDVYDKTDRIGGRVKTIDFSGRKYEAGGSIIHSKNMLAVNLAKKLGLSKKSSDIESNEALMAIHDGHEFVFQESSWKLVTLARILRNYGLDPIKVQGLIHSMIEDFSHIYFYQNRNISYKTVDDMLSSMNHKFPVSARISFREYLESKGLHNNTIEQLIGSIALVNYGQSVDQLHAFVGSVSTSGADFGGELWSVEGGNEQIPQRMLSSSNANVILKSSITKISNQGSSLQITDSNGNNEIYDAVVIANPLPLSSMTFADFDDTSMEKISQELKRGKYHQTVATFVAGKRSGNLTLPGIEEVIICDPSSPFQSISRQIPVEKYDKTNCPSCLYSVFKIFSREELTQDQLSFLFDEVHEKMVIPWLAYPDYKRLDSFPSFVLSSRLFYVNGIEWAASAMEMSLLSGHNVALLVQDFLINQKKRRQR